MLIEHQTQRRSHRSRERLLMDGGWRFHLGDIPVPPSLNHSAAYGTGWSKTGAFRGAAAPAFDDSGWRMLDLPHDWVVEQPFSPAASSARGYRPGGVGWYRRTFALPAADEGKHLALEFEGIFREATVYLNGHRLGHHPSGYCGQRYDISDQALYNDDNVLAVRVDARENEGWWYEGGGIYRHVWLTKTAVVYIAPESVVVSAELDDGHQWARLTLQTTVANAGEVPANGELVATVLDADDRPVSEVRTPLAVAAGDESWVSQSLTLDHPRLWSVDKPMLYRLHTVVLLAGQPVDRVDTMFGVRSIRFDPAQGFFLNGQPLKITGVSNHEDHAGVGLAVPDRLFEFRIAQLKAMGANAWRCAHNPPAPAFLDACDRLGMLVLDETRCMNSTEDGRRQLEFMVRRDRNHPAVILWSLGNEEPHQGTATGQRIIRRMKQWVRRLDPTRPVTLAMSGCWGEPVSPLLDVQGCNYQHDGYDTFHAQFPQQPMLVTENFTGGWATRGEYENDEARGVFSCYDRSPLRPGCTGENLWRLVAERAFLAGTFPWTGFDYRGEPGPRGWPCVSSNFGILDTCGFPKDIFYYYQSWWSEPTVLHIFPHWNWTGREGQSIPVWCYSNCDEVELFLNGASLGRQPMSRNGHLEWDVCYQPGGLLAKGYREGRPVAEREVTTTGTPAALRLTTESPPVWANGEDVAIVTVAVVDEAGHVVPDADNDINFVVEGAATFLGVGNGNPASHEPDTIPRRKVFHGLCQVLLRVSREPGAIMLQAETADLPPAKLVIMAKPATPRPSVPIVDPATQLDFGRTGTMRVLQYAGQPPAGWNTNEPVGNGWKVVPLTGRCGLPSPSLIRILFTPTTTMPTKGLEADLGAIHDYDETWLNGVHLGTFDPANTNPETAWRIRRRYRIPDGLLRPGRENLLAIRAWNRRTNPEAKTILTGPLLIRPIIT